MNKLLHLWMFVLWSIFIILMIIIFSFSKNIEASEFYRFFYCFALSMSWILIGLLFHKTKLKLSKPYIYLIYLITIVIAYVVITDLLSWSSLLLNGWRVLIILLLFSLFFVIFWYQYFKSCYFLFTNQKWEKDLIKQ